MNASTRLLVAVLVSAAVGFGLGLGLAPGGAPPPSDGGVVLPHLDAPVAPRSGDAERPNLPTGLETGHQRDVAEAASPGAITVSPDRLAAAKAAVDAPSIDPAAGDGVIRGRVVDATGAPLPGVTVIVTESSTSRYDPARSTAGQAPPTDQTLGEALDQAASSWATGRSSRHRTTVAADGSFAFTGLPDEPFRVRAYREGYTFRVLGARTVRPGHTIELRGREVHAVELDVRLVDGTPADDAVLLLTVGNEVRQIGWSAADPVLTFERPAFELIAYADHLEGIDFNYREGPASRLRSKPMLVDTDEQAGRPLLVQLEERRGVVGRVTRDWPTDEQLRVLAIALDAAASFDPEAEHDTEHETYVRGGDYALMDLPMGLYAIGLQRGGRGPIIAHELVDLTGGIVVVDLHEGAPLAQDHLIVTCLDDLGRMVDGVDYQYQARSSEGNRSGGLRGFVAPDGNTWLPLSQLVSFDHDAWPLDASLELTGDSPLHGPRTVDLAQGQRRLTITFSDPVSLTVTIAGYADRGDAEYVVWVMEPSDDESSWGGQPLAQSKHPRGWGNGPSISDDGTVTFQTIPPGTWSVVLQKGDDWFGGAEQLDEVTVEVGSSDAVATLRVPTLHTLLVLAPTMSEGETLWLSRTEGRNRGSTRGQLDADGRCTFEDLVPGTYTLQGGNHRMEVEVPGPEVVYQPPRTVAMRVAIATESGALYQAGLRSGDEIIGWSGMYLDDGLDPDTFKGITEGLDLYVRRAGEVLELGDVTISEGLWNQEAMGGTMIPIKE